MIIGRTVGGHCLGRTPLVQRNDPHPPRRYGGCIAIAVVRCNSSTTNPQTPGKYYINVSTWVGPPPVHSVWWIWYGVHIDGSISLFPTQWSWLTGCCGWVDVSHERGSKSYWHYWLQGEKNNGHTLDISLLGLGLRVIFKILAIVRLEL